LARRFERSLGIEGPHRREIEAGFGPFLAGLSMAFTIIALAAWLMTLAGFVISRVAAHRA
jgi:hypothetical protein